MSLLEKVQKQIPSADQALIDRILSQLNKTEAEVVDAGQTGAFIRRCRESMGAIAPAAPQAAPAGAIGGAVEEVKPESPAPARSVDEAQADREAAMLAIANAGLDQEVRIYTKALEQANAIEADDEAAEIEELAKEIVDNRRTSRKVTRNFLKKFGEQSTARVLHQFGGVMAALPQAIDVEVVS